MPDDKFVDATIRPVLPSRPSIADRIEQDLPPMRAHPSIPQDETPFTLPLKPENPMPNNRKARHSNAVRRRNGKVKDPHRSAAAKAIWAKRKAAQRHVGKSPLLAAPYGREGEDLAHAVTALLKLKPAHQDLALQIARSVVL